MIEIYADVNQEQIDSRSTISQVRSIETKVARAATTGFDSFGVKMGGVFFSGKVNGDEGSKSCHYWI